MLALKITSSNAKSRSGAYVKNMSNMSVYTLCTIMQQEGKLTSLFVKYTLNSQFPANKNVTKTHVYLIKKQD